MTSAFRQSTSFHLMFRTRQPTGMLFRVNNNHKSKFISAEVMIMIMMMMVLMTMMLVMVMMTTTMSLVVVVVMVVMVVMLKDLPNVTFNLILLSVSEPASCGCLQLQRLEKETVSAPCERQRWGLAFRDLEPWKVMVGVKTRLGWGCLREQQFLNRDQNFPVCDWEIRTGGWRERQEALISRCASRRIRFQERFVQHCDWPIDFCRLANNVYSKLVFLVF